MAKTKFTPDRNTPKTAASKDTPVGKELSAMDQAKRLAMWLILTARENAKATLAARKPSNTRTSPPGARPQKSAGTGCDQHPARLTTMQPLMETFYAAPSSTERTPGTLPGWRGFLIGSGGGKHD